MTASEIGFSLWWNAPRRCERERSTPRRAWDLVTRLKDHSLTFAITNAAVHSSTNARRCPTSRSFFPLFRLPLSVVQPRPLSVRTRISRCSGMNCSGMSCSDPLINKVSSKDEWISLTQSNVFSLMYNVTVIIVVINAITWLRWRNRRESASK